MKTITRGIAKALDERRCLRGRSAFQLAIADRFAQLNEAQWRAVTRGHSAPRAPGCLRLPTGRERKIARAA